MTPRAGQRGGLYRALAIASGAKERRRRVDAIRTQLAAASNENDRAGRCLGDFAEY